MMRYIFNLACIFLSVFLYLSAEAMVIRGSGGAVITPVYTLDFEENNLTDFDSTSDADGHMTVTAGAAMGGTSYGLNLLIADTNTMFGRKTLSADLTVNGKLKIQFYIDPNTMTMSNGDDLNAVMVQLSSTPGNFAIFEFAKVVAGYQVQVSPYNDAGGLTKYGATITDAPTRIELEVARASTDAASDGTITLKVDGSTVNTWNSVDNYDIFTIVSQAAVGVVTGPDIGTSGTFFIDEVKIYDNF